MTNLNSCNNIVSHLQGEFLEGIKRDKNTIAFFLFGSYSKGQATAMSDVDFAVLFNNSVKKESFLSERLQLMAQLSLTLGIDKLDLVVLNEAPASLAYRVIKDGKLIYLHQGDESQLINFKARTYDKYFDFQPTQKLMSEGLAKRIKEGSFGGR